MHVPFSLFFQIDQMSVTRAKYIWNNIANYFDIVRVYTCVFTTNKYYSVGRRNVELRVLYQVLLSDKTTSC